MSVPQGIQNLVEFEQGHFTEKIRIIDWKQFHCFYHGAVNTLLYEVTYPPDPSIFQDRTVVTTRFATASEGMGTSAIVGTTTIKEET